MDEITSLELKQIADFLENIFHAQKGLAAWGMFYRANPTPLS